MANQSFIINLSMSFKLITPIMLMFFPSQYSLQLYLIGEMYSKIVNGLMEFNFLKILFSIESQILIHQLVFSIHQLVFYHLILNKTMRLKRIQCYLTEVFWKQFLNTYFLSKSLIIRIIINQLKLLNMNNQESPCLTSNDQIQAQVIIEDQRNLLQIYNSFIKNIKAIKDNLRSFIDLESNNSFDRQWNQMISGYFTYPQHLKFIPQSCAFYILQIYVEALKFPQRSHLLSKIYDFFVELKKIQDFNSIKKNSLNNKNFLEPIPEEIQVFNQTAIKQNFQRQLMDGKNNNPNNLAGLECLRQPLKGLEIQLNQIDMSEYYFVKTFNWLKEKPQKGRGFYESCIQVMMTNLDKYHQKEIALWKFCEILQLLKILQFFKPLLNPQKAIQFTHKIISTLRQIIDRPQLQNISLNADSQFQLICDNLKTWYIYHDGYGIEQSIQEIHTLTPRFGVALIFHPNATKDIRLKGVVILQNCVKQQFNPQDSLKQLDRIKYIKKDNERLWNLLTNDQADFELVRTGQNLFQHLIGRNTKFESIQFESNYHKNFFKSLRSKANNLRNFFFKSIKPRELGNQIIENLLNSLQEVEQKPQFYSLQFMELIFNIATFLSSVMKKKSKKIIHIMTAICCRHSSIFKNQQILKTASLAFMKLFDNIVSTSIITQEMVDTYLKFFQNFVQTQNQAMIQTCEYLFLKKSHKNSESFKIAIGKLSNEQKIIEKIVKKIGQNDVGKSQFQQLLTMVMKCIKPCQRLNQFKKFIIQLLGSRKVFTQFIQQLPVSDCQHILKEVFLILSKNQSINVDPQCLEPLFYQINNLIVHKINKIYKVSSDPNQLKFINELFTLLEFPLPTQFLEQSAKIITNVFTSFTEEYERFGRQKSVQLMARQSKKMVDDFKLFITRQKPILGHLILMKHLMFATQTHGTGKLKACRAFIATSLIKIKVYNGLTDYQTGSAKVYDKMVPSNMTLFELLTKLGKKFNRQWYEITLQNHNSTFSLSMQMNGHTLEELQTYLSTDLYARKNTTFTLIKEPLLLMENQLNPIFLQTLKQIFGEVAQNGKMGPNDVKKFILKVTGTEIDLNDPKVKEMRQLYGSKETGLIDEESFINFYKNSCITANGSEIVRKNLYKAGYRTDFSKITEPIKLLREQQMFRYHIKTKPQIYKLLFELTKGIGLESSLAKQVLNHLPLSDIQVEGESQIYTLLMNLTNWPQQFTHLGYSMIKLKHLLDRETKKNNPLNLNNQPVSWGNNMIKRNRDTQNQVIKQEDISRITIHQIYDAFPNDQDQRPEMARSSIESDMPPKQETISVLQHNFFSIQPEVEESIFTQIQNENSSQMVEQNQLSTPKLTQILYHKQFDVKVFTFLKQIINKSSTNRALQKTVSVHILRSMMSFPSLNTKQLKKKNFPIDKIWIILNNIKPSNLKIFDFELFFELLEQDLSANNYILYEPLLALCLYTYNIKWRQSLESQLFSHMKFVRTITLNFLIFYSLNYNFPFNFLQINPKSEPQRCEQWLNLLQFYIIHKKDLNFQYTLTLLKTRLLQENQTLSQQSQTFFTKAYVRIMKIIFQQNLNQIRLNSDEAFSFLTPILHQTVDNSTRLIFYDMLYQVDPKKTLKLMYEFIKAIKLESITQQKKRIFVGIRNLGSTCYMNSIIQQFFMIESFRKIILNFPIKNIPPATQVNGIQIIDDFLYQFQKMYVALEHSQKKSFYPKEFCLTIKDIENRPINTSIQEDAHEFLNRLFGKIQKYCKDADKLKELQKIFLGKTICEITCSECQSKLFKIQDFYHLSVEVKGIPNLMQSFKRFTAPQTIEDYKCEKCNKKSIITKQTSLMDLPQILIINLQRIIFDMESLAHVKVHSELEFPEQIALDQVRHQTFRSKNSSFRLKGVVIHSGTSEGGHYYSIIKFGEDWYRFDDQNISKVGFEDLKQLSFGGKTNNLVFDRVHSTNAYILFYELEKTKGINFGSAQTIDSLNNGVISESFNGKYDNQRFADSTTFQSFKSEVLNQNKSIYLEFQIHQPSFFEFLNKVYASQHPTQFHNNPNNFIFSQEWRLLQVQTLYEELFPIYLQSLKFFAHCYKLPDSVLRDTAIAMCELICLLPEKTDDFFREQVDKKQWVQVICSHDDSRVRKMYKVVMEKASLTYCNYFPFEFKPINHNGIQTSLKSGQFLSTRRFQQMIVYFINAVSSQLIVDNIYKSFYFFELLKTIIDSDKRILMISLKSTLLLDLLELLMANQSPNAQKNKKRPDLPCDNAPPLIQSVSRLIQFRKNAVGDVYFKNEQYSEDTYSQLSDKQSKILNSPIFYKRIMRFKYDDGSLRIILACMCYNDKHLSTTLSRFFLTCINDLNQVDNIPCLMNNIITFLEISDELQVYRLECLLGIAQIFSYKKLSNLVVSYGLGYSSSSKVIRYFSAAFFSQNDKIKPLLELLYQKRTEMTDFEVTGIIALLQLIAPLPLIINYLLSLPPPSYLHVDYFTWIEEYIEKHLPKEGQQNLSSSSKIILKLNEVYKIVQKKISQLNDKPQIPVMKQIIGRNKNVQFMEIKNDFNQNYQIRVYAHETYVLDNIPIRGNGNYSLPEALFQRRQQNSHAFYFIENSMIKNSDSQVRTMKTLISLFISSIKPLLLKFNLPHFNHQIFISKGQTRINFGYTTEKLDDYLKVEVLEDDQVKQEPKPQGFANYVSDKNVIRDRTNSMDSVKSMVNCPFCTFLNKADADKCEVCASEMHLR